MLRVLLKSKIHRARITDANVDYEGSISIPLDLMNIVGLWEGEKVLVASITSGERLETYVQTGNPGTGNIVINGGAAHRIRTGDRVTIMAFTLSTEPVDSLRVVCDPSNRVIAGPRDRDA